MFKNAYYMQLQNQNNIKVYKTTTTGAATASDQSTEQLKAIGQVLDTYITLADSATEKKFLSDPVLFNKVKIKTKIKMNEKEEEKVETHIEVFFGETDLEYTFTENDREVKGKKDLKKLRTTRIEGQAGVFSDGEFITEDKHLEQFVTGCCIAIQDLNLAELKAKDALRIFEGIAVLLDAQQFVKTKINDQIAQFLTKHPQIDSVIKLKKMYQLNHSGHVKDDIYLELANSVKLLKNYQAIENKNEALPNYQCDAEILTAERFLPNSQNPAITVATADDDAAFKVISAAKELRDILKLGATATNNEVINAVEDYKPSIAKDNKN